ncbi:hypothetical protein PHMEG_0005719 [Phytophthora megakarya]|uniref:Integrase catalytic domain-containing protein n=1 Tax=Phytophthora megakarya TaxID=4795 RepID=A0A225WQF6_9STRA|nr:hypothetical protein PHMEG_0005719 [Phytophthora megakarya]
MLAIIHCLNRWRVYLIDGGCTVETDHRSLEKMLTQTSINRRPCRWYDQLADCQLKFCYIPGETNTIADALSRRSDFEIVFLTLRNNQIVQKTNKVVRDKLLQKRLPEIANADRFRYSEPKDLVYYHHNGSSRIWLPSENDEVRHAILSELHDSGISGHPGLPKRYGLYRRSSIGKICTIPLLSTYRPVKPVSERKEELAKHLDTNRWLDFVTGLPVNDAGNDAVLTATQITAKELAGVFLNQYVRYHGIPRDITSDRDSKFPSHFWQECAKLTGTTLRMLAAYQQEKDGQLERINAIFATYLRSYVGGYRPD